MPRIQNGIIQTLFQGREARLCAGMQKAKIADFLEALGQHVLQEAADTVQGRERHRLPGSVVRLIAEGHLAVLHAHQSPVRQGDAVDVGCQVFQRAAPVPDRLAMHHPFPGPGRRRHLREELGIGGLEGIAEFGPEDRAQSGAGDEKGRMRGDPLAGFRVESPGRNEIVDVQVIAHAAVPGMQRPDHADVPAQPLRIARQRLQRFGGTLKEQTGDQGLVGAGDRVQVVRQGAGHQKVGHRQQFLQLTVAPAVGAILTAFGAVAVAAGMVAVDELRAVVAVKHLAS